MAIGIPVAVRSELNRIDRTEVALHTRELVLEDQVEEAREKLASGLRSSRHIARFLSASEHHVVMRRRNARRVHWTIRLVRAPRR